MSRISPFCAALALQCVGMPPSARAEAPPPAAPEKAESPAPAPAAAEPAPEIEKLADGRLRLGRITFDAKSREVEFPAVVNMNKGMIEFPVVHKNGRIHEAIFATEALPLHLETVLRLLRYRPSGEVWATYPGIDMENPPPFEEWPAPVYPPAQPDAHVQVFAHWKAADGTEQSADIRTLLFRSTPDPVDPEKTGPDIRFDSLAPHWVFTGSQEKMGPTVESLGGAMVGIRPEPECSFNTLPGDAIHTFEWFADPKRIPDPDTPVTIKIRPLTPQPAATPTP